MITIKHNRTTFKVTPDHAALVHDLLATIDKSKGRKGPRLAKPRGDAKHDSSKRDYPQFNPECMLTSDYVTAYIALNHRRLHLMPLDIAPQVDRTPPRIDPTIPEVIEESEP